MLVAIELGLGTSHVYFGNSFFSNAVSQAMQEELAGILGPSVRSSVIVCMIVCALGEKECLVSGAP